MRYEVRVLENADIAFVDPKTNLLAPLHHTWAYQRESLKTAGFRSGHYRMVELYVFLELSEIEKLYQTEFAAGEGLTFNRPQILGKEVQNLNEMWKHHVKSEPVECYSMIDASGTERPCWFGIFRTMEDAELWAAEIRRLMELFKQSLSEPAQGVSEEFSAMRFQHLAIFSPPKTGKSNILSNLILEDLHKVVKKEMSVVVMESNSDLIKGVAGLACFAPGGALDGKLITVDVEDVEYPIALNLFDLGKTDGALTPLEKETLHNTAVSMLDYIFTALLETELTGRQKTLFNFTVALMLEIPGATLDTMIAVLQKDGVEQYRKYLPNTDPDTRSFFEHKFDTKEFYKTKTEVEDRLYAVKRNRTLARIFSAPKTKLDLAREINSGKVILINAAKSVLQSDGVLQFGRFWIAMILMAAQKRAFLDKLSRLDTHVYLDECQDVVSHDKKIAEILRQARKFRVGMTLATQDLDAIEPPSVVNAIISNTAIKLATKLSDAHAHTLARDMRCEPAFIMNRPKFHHALYVEGWKKPKSVTYPLAELMTYDRMTEAQAMEVRRVMRERYCQTLSPGVVKEVMEGW